MRLRRTHLVVISITLLCAACGGGDGGEAQGGGSEGGGAGGDSIVFWTTENLDDRVAVQRELISAFTEQNGIQVELDPGSQDYLANLMIANAASGVLPDVVFHGLEFAAGWAEEGLIDPEAANTVVEDLGRDTFSAPAIDLATIDDQVVSVPADGWGQLLVYRQDLFDEAGLESPDTYERILAAAEALHDPDNQMSGITLAADPARHYDTAWVPEFASLGYLFSLDGSELLADESDYFPTPMSSNKFNGKTYGVPQVTDSLALLYNKKIFTDAGIGTKITAR